MKKLTALCLLTLSLNCFAVKKKHEHREHSAHEHGAGQLAIAFDLNKGKIEFRTAAESILGFEYKAKTKKDIKTLEDTVSYFEKNMNQLIQLESSLNCQFSKEKIGQMPEGDEKDVINHSDWIASFDVTCAKSPVGTKLTIDFSHFKKIHDLDITILVDSIQKSAEFKGKAVSVELR